VSDVEFGVLVLW